MLQRRALLNGRKRIVDHSASPELCRVRLTEFAHENSMRKSPSIKMEMAINDSPLGPSIHSMRCIDYACACAQGTHRSHYNNITSIIITSIPIAHSPYKAEAKAHTTYESHHRTIDASVCLSGVCNAALKTFSVLFCAVYAASYSARTMAAVSIARLL